MAEPVLTSPDVCKSNYKKWKYIIQSGFLCSLCIVEETIHLKEV